MNISGPQQKRIKRKKNIWVALVDLFLPEVVFFQNFDLRLKMRTAVAIVYIIIISSLYFTYRFFIFYEGWHFFTVIVFLLTPVCFFFLFAMKRTFHIKYILAGVLFVFISLNLVLMYHNGNGMATGLLWSFIITIMSIFLLGPSGGSVMALLSLAGSSYLFWLNNTGHQFPHINKLHNEEFVILYFVIFLSILTALLTWLYEISKNHSSRLESLKSRQLKKMYIEKVSAEKELEAANRKLQEVNRTLEERVMKETNKVLENEKIFAQQSKMAAMGEMLGAIAHQWRQPLNTLAITVQDLLDAYDAGELNHDYLANSITQSMNNINHMSQTIDDFRNFMEPSKIQEDFSVNKAILDAVNISNAQLTGHQIHLTLSGLAPHDPQVIVNGFASEFKQVILNLINNAKDAIEEYRIKTGNPGYRGEVKISIEDDKVTKIIFEDNGGGILPEALDRLFDPYFTTKDPTVGTGIGLYLSKRIIEQNMSGWLFAENTRDGAKFIIILSKA